MAELCLAGNIRDNGCMLHCLANRRLKLSLIPDTAEDGQGAAYQESCKRG